MSTLGNDRQVVLLRNVPFPSLARALVRRPLLRPSFVVDWARLHFGKAPNVSIVAAGGGEGRRWRPTKPRQGHKHHENMVLSGRQPAANEATERCRLQHLFGRLGPSRVRCSMFNACMERRSMRRIASLSNPSGLPSGHLIRRLPMVFEGWTTDIHVPLSASQNTPVFNRISFDRPASAT